MAVSGLDAAASTVVTKTPAYTISAGSNRILIACAALEADTVTAAPTYGGQTLSLVDSELVTGDLNMYIYCLLEAGIAAATDTTLDWSGGIALSNYSLSHRSYQGVNQAVPTNVVSTGINASTPNPQTNADITIGAGSMAVYFCGCGDTTSATWTAITEQTDAADASHTGSLADGTSGAGRCTWATQNRRGDINLELVADSTGGVRFVPTKGPFGRDRFLSW